MTEQEENRLKAVLEASTTLTKRVRDLGALRSVVEEFSNIEWRNYNAGTVVFHLVNSALRDDLLEALDRQAAALEKQYAELSLTGGE